MAKRWSCGTLVRTFAGTGTVNTIGAFLFLVGSLSSVIADELPDLGGGNDANKPVRPI